VRKHIDHHHHGSGSGSRCCEQHHCHRSAYRQTHNHHWKAHQFSRRFSLPENEWIEEVAQTNHDHTTDLNDASNAAGPLSKIDSAVSKLARRCLDESAALTVLLQNLKVPLRSDGTKSKRGTAKAVFRTLIQNGDLKRRHKKLVSLERQLAALLLYAIKTSLLQGFEDLRDSVERNGRDCVTPAHLDG
jgi:hypothetical protein